ncbi:beta-phosphoglucomutase [Anaerobranca gottschalkii]|uniref:Beta-phosphoglucomutase n=1 Tax=Anaerobranca gottschalkii DSM 13577 TaxID=1120990 RepID=A0A1H9YNW6_9FIRM|nr:beta-phosphoglucomutase [Anaerobranca gottschalkii]SES70753.1 beta-phosphoglucomutase [Anaerobranca gottschalkii DSM 13577]
MILPKGVIFDLDGVIVDTAEFHYLAWKNLGKRLGISIDREFNERLKGVSRLESLELILERGKVEKKFTKEEKEKLAEEKNNEYISLIQSITPKDILPGIGSLLEKLKINKIKIGLASASLNAERVIKLLKVDSYFDYIADPKKVGRGKPEPDIFLDVANGLNIQALECVGIEDAQAGIDGIKKAGMFAVGIGKTPLLNVDFQVENTDDLTFELLVEKYNNWLNQKIEIK